jgi:uracil DNA glycosylase
LKLKLILIIFNHSVLTSKKTQSITITNIILLMLFKEIIAVCSENNMKLINVLCGQNAQLLIVKAHST